MKIFFQKKIRIILATAAVVLSGAQANASGGASLAQVGTENADYALRGALVTSLPQPLSLIAAFAGLSWQSLPQAGFYFERISAFLDTMSRAPAAPSRTDMPGGIDGQKATVGSGAAAFDTVAIPFKRLGAIAKLAPALQQMADGAALGCKGEACNTAFKALQTVTGDVSQSSVRDKLNTVNAVVNQAIRYRSDEETYHTADHWSAPSETLARQEGDCEDFAILKMAALRAEGFDPSRLSLVVVFDKKRHFYHAVLSVEMSGQFYVLDNMRNQVLRDTQLPDYVPLYSIRDGKGFIHGSRRKDQVASLAGGFDAITPGEGAAF